MKAIAILAGTLTVLNVAHAQWRPEGTIGSVSGQFFVNARSLVSPGSMELAAGPDMVTLEPPLLAISCERIKGELLHELKMPDQWRGKIFVMLHPAQSADDPITIIPERLSRTWDFRVELPDALDRNRFVEAIVRVCLLEIANRNAKEQPTEIPEWLARGLSRQLMGSSAIKIILRPPHRQEDGWYVTRETVDFSDSPHKPGSQTRKLNPLTESAEILRTNAPLTFDELSWPTDEQLDGNGEDVYGSSAQLFVTELLHMNKGPERLSAMLAEMPDYLNWQLAFLDAFRETFQKPLDVEKWWALEIAQFSGRDLMHLLTPEESARQLDVLFEFPIDVQIGQGPPMRTGITLQTIIRGWNRTRQLQTIKAKLWELEILRLRIAPEYMPLVEEYRQVLQEYFKKRSASTRILAEIGLVSDTSVADAIQRLDALDLRRITMRRQIQTPMAAAEPAPAAAP